MTLVFLAPVGALLALCFAAVLTSKMLKADEGTDKMKEISLEIRKGAYAFLKRQYRTVSIFMGGLFIFLLILSFGLGWVPIFTPFAFLSGAFFSALSGFIGMNVATRANTRTAAACRTSLNNGLRIAFTSGAVMSLVVVGLGLLDISAWYLFLSWYYYNVATATDPLYYIASTLITFGIGASIMNLFARVGGGVYTKAADVGADLVGKVEEDIPEDDPRNPAVIADNVGDNVGDIAGMGADLYESYVVSIISAVALGIWAGYGTNGAALPLLLAGAGIICSIVGTFLVKTKEGATQHDLLATLRRGVYGASFLIAIAAFLLVNYLLPGYLGVYYAILAGLIAGNLIGFTTEYYTSGAYKPTQILAKSSETGPATIIINGLSLGMLSTALPVIIIGATVMFSFFINNGSVDFNQGLFGIAISAVGMLSTLGITLATDAYGPIADNAGGIAEMSGLTPDVRERTDALDTLGNTTAATGKGFAIGSAALTTLVLIAAFREEIFNIIARDNLAHINFNLEILNPALLIGMFFGTAVIFVFSSMTMKAVARAAESIVIEVRRQFREIPGLREGHAKADSQKCVDICAKSALKELIMPTILVVLAPIVTGFLLGPSGVAGLLAGATVSGFAMALMMANAGGAWDNAKKYVEAGNFGGKGSDNHKAVVVGDTVGDPFKDTSGPSINTVIKLLAIVAIVFATFILNITIMP